MIKTKNIVIYFVRKNIEDLSIVFELVDDGSYIGYFIFMTIQVIHFHTFKSRTDIKT